MSVLCPETGHGQDSLYLQLPPPPLRPCQSFTLRPYPAVPSLPVTLSKSDSLFERFSLCPCNCPPSLLLATLSRTPTGLRTSSTSRTLQSPASPAPPSTPTRAARAPQRRPMTASQQQRRSTPLTAMNMRSTHMHMATSLNMNMSSSARFVCKGGV